MTLKKKIILGIIATPFVCLLLLAAALCEVMAIDRAAIHVKYEGPQDAHVSIMELRVAADLGDGAAARFLGRFYAYGWNDITRDDDAALHWFRLGARPDDGDENTLAGQELTVGQNFARGENVAADPQASQTWLRRAAADGSKEAAALLKSDSKAK